MVIKYKQRALIVGLKSHTLTNKEKIFLKYSKPWGVILFSRNIINLNQLKRLTNNIKKIVNNKNFPIFIDEEGGDVSRLSQIINLKYFSANFFGNLYIKDRLKFNYTYKSYINFLSNIFHYTGININTVPVLDILKRNTHTFLRNRIFSNNPDVVSSIGNITTKLFNDNKIATVMKHIPGHGSANKDSHLKLPLVNESKKILFSKDFYTFRTNKSFFAMTGHVLYKKIDPINCATHSKIIIKNIIRKNIRFNGILISDDISMKSLNKSIILNAKKALDAGCNLILHCNGNMSEMTKLSKIIPYIDKFTMKKSSEFFEFLS